jgi:hypothetical protein
VVVVALALASLIAFILYKRRVRRRQAAGISSGAFDPHQLDSDTNKKAHENDLPRKEHTYELAPGDPQDREVLVRPEFKHELGN